MPETPSTAPPLLALAAPESAPHSAWEAGRRRLRARLPRNALLTLILCLGIALVLTAIDGRGFRYKLVYSVCIGLCCMSIVDGTRLLSAWLVDRLRGRRGLPFVDDYEAGGWRATLPGALLAVLLGPLLGLQLADAALGLRSPSLLNFGSSDTRVTLAFSLLATAVAVLVMSTIERLGHARAQAQAAQREAAENQLRLLQSQLEPHMLFNTLANLRVLIGLDPQRAQAMLDRLIAFLRATLSASRTTLRPLAAEFAQLDDYLALMAIRMGPRLQVELDLPGELADAAVPPLLLQPLVENAIKHGLEPQVEGGRIRVSASRDGARLRLEVQDTGVGLRAAAAAHASAAAASATAPPASFGLEQVRQRLATLYGGAASLRLLALPADGGRSGGCSAVVELPLASTTDQSLRAAAAAAPSDFRAHPSAKV